MAEINKLVNKYENGNGVFNINNLDDKDIFVIGDIHGDYQVLIHCLVDLCESCNINKEDQILSWIPNNKNIIIFCGDLIHRKRFADHVLDDEESDVFIIEAIIRLKQEAIKNGGNILIILGNHEIMNIIFPSESIYTSPKNILKNKEYFEDSNKIKELINNSFAWIKINNILISHGGLCSKYYTINLSDKNIQKDGDELITYVNNQFNNYFGNSEYKLQMDIRIKKSGYKLFEEFDNSNYDSDNLSNSDNSNHNNKNHNMFWCRQWGYDGINCDNFEKTLNKLNCTKMIIAHCPQFLQQNSPKMINFECKDKCDDNYSLARIDLGMSRCFDYNKKDKFLYYINYNYNRKMSVLKLFLSTTNNLLFFNNNSIISKKISCIQYLLIKYGLTKIEWEDKGITTNWIGFEFIDEKLLKINDTCSNIPNNITKFKKSDINILYCLLYPIINNIDDVKNLKSL